jgi:hypothetical protein
MDSDSEHVMYLFIAKSLIFCAISELLRKDGGNFSRDFQVLVHVHEILFHENSKNAFLFLSS